MVFICKLGKACKASANELTSDAKASEMTLEAESKWTMNNVQFGPATNAVTAFIPVIVTSTYLLIQK